jgi:hypothetical protein
MSFYPRFAGALLSRPANRPLAPGPASALWQHMSDTKLNLVEMLEQLFYLERYAMG